MRQALMEQTIHEDNEGIIPACLVDECREDKLCWLMRASSCDGGDRDDEEGAQKPESWCQTRESQRYCESTDHQNSAVSIIGNALVPNTFNKRFKNSKASMNSQICQALTSNNGWNRLARKPIWKAMTATLAAAPTIQERRLAHPVIQL